MIFGIGLKFSLHPFRTIGVLFCARLVIISNPIYHSDGVDKPLVILHGRIKSPPFSIEARRCAGFLLRRLQQGYLLTMPDSRPMPGIGARCHELRLPDAESRITWRVMYRLDADAVVITEIFAKKTQTTPPQVIARCQKRLYQYDSDRKRI